MASPRMLKGGHFAEQLADEMGLYANDPPLSGLGYLLVSRRASRLWSTRDCHAKRWTREQAAASMVAATGDQESSIVTEIERYCVWPGQACACMIGRQALVPRGKRPLNPGRSLRSEGLRRSTDQRLDAAFGDRAASAAMGSVGSEGVVVFGKGVRPRCHAPSTTCSAFPMDSSGDDGERHRLVALNALKIGSVH